MYPQHAAQHRLANGGLVQRLKQFAGMDPERNARMAAYRANEAQEKAAAAQAAAPVATPPAAPQKALSQYAAGSATERRMKEIDGYANGGAVRGPGTGTSDDVQAEVSEGTYIMPADSTKAIGSRALSAMANKKIPVRLSNGEHELTPQQVHAVGVQALDQMKNATHKPAPKGLAKGLRPEMFFADGGMVENDVTRVGNSYSGGNIGGNITVNGQAPGGASSTLPGVPSAPNAAAQGLAAPLAGAMPTSTAVPALAAPAAATAAPMGWTERNDLRSNQVTASSMQDSPERRAAQSALGLAGAPAPMGAKPPAPEEPIPARRPVPGLIDISKRSGIPGFATGGQVTEDEARRRALVAQIPTGGMNAPAADGSQSNPLNSDAGRNIMNTLGAVPGAASVPYAGARAAGSLAGLVGQSAPAASLLGRAASGAAPAGVPLLGAAGIGAAYSEDKMRRQAPAAVPAATPRATEPRSPVGMTAEQAQAQGPVGEQVGYNPSYDQQRAADQSGQPPNFSPAQAQQAQGVSAPIVRNSTNDWAARKALENAATAASSITANGGQYDSRRGTVGGGKSDRQILPPSQRQATYGAMVANDFALQGVQASGEQAAMRESGATARTQMQEQGATGRSLVSIALEQQKVNQAGEAWGYTNRANKLVEAARNQVAAERDPGKRRDLVQYMQDLEGKSQQADPYLVVPGGQQVDETGKPYNMPSSVFNRQTQQFVQQPAQGGAKRAAPAAGVVEGGYRFKGGDPSDASNWVRA